MTYFGNGEREHWTSQQCPFVWQSLGKGYPSSRTDTRKTGRNDHHKSDMSVPSGEAPDLVITQTHLFARFKILLNTPPLPDCFDHLGKCCAKSRKNEVIRLLLWIVKTTTDEQEVSAIILPLVEHGHNRPIVETRPLKSIIHTQSLPIAGKPGESFRFCHCHLFAPRSGLYAHWLVARYR